MLRDVRFRMAICLYILDSIALESTTPVQRKNNVFLKRFFFNCIFVTFFKPPSVFFFFAVVNRSKDRDQIRNWSKKKKRCKHSISLHNTKWLISVSKPLVVLRLYVGFHYEIQLDQLLIWLFLVPIELCICLEI